MLESLISILLLFGFVAIFVLSVAMIFINEPAMPSKYELDEIACSQMRDSGWTEEEIKEFMDKNGGYYDRD